MVEIVQECSWRRPLCMTPLQLATKTVSRKINSSVLGEVAKENFFVDFFKLKRTIIHV